MVARGFGRSVDASLINASHQTAFGRFVRLRPPRSAAQPGRGTLTQQLTDHFTLAELTQSQTAARRGIDNEPTQAIVVNLTRTAQVLEQVRTLLGGKSILVSSGYRSPALNAAVGGARDSAHLQGLAADFTCPGYGTPLDVARKIAASNIAFDQVIQEGTWVHIGLAPAGRRARGEVLTAKFGPGPTTYMNGLA